MAVAKLQRGEPVMDNYTPGVAVAEGAVVVIGDYPVVSHTDMEAGVMGAVAIRGGIYRMPKASGGSTAIAGRKRVYWDAGNQRVTETAASNKGFGITSPNGSVDADTTVEVEHQPFLDLT